MVDLSKPSVTPTSSSPNHLVFSAQLLYPYWAEHAPQAGYARHTEIHFFRANEQEPWTVIALPENDRFYYDANENSENEFEQRYLKFVSGKDRVTFKEGSTPEETADNAFNALRSCYPVRNQNVLNDAQDLLTSEFAKAFSNSVQNAPLSEGNREKTPSELRAEKYIQDQNLAITDNSADINNAAAITNEDTGYTKISFGKTTFHLHTVDNEVMVFADTAGFNSLDKGMLTLSADSENWENEIKEAWLKQQVNVSLGQRYNPETMNAPPYQMQLQIPATLICNTAKALMQTTQQVHDAQKEQMDPTAETPKVHTTQQLHDAQKVQAAPKVEIPKVRNPQSSVDSSTIADEYKTIKEHINAQKAGYAERINNQWFSYFRSGAQKNAIIQQGLDQVIKHLDNGDVTEARQAIQQLKNDISINFGTTNFLHQKTESIKLVEEVERELGTIQTNLFKDQVKEMKADAGIEANEVRPGL